MLFRVYDNYYTGKTPRIIAPFRLIAMLAPLVAIAFLACAARAEPQAAPVEDDRTVSANHDTERNAVRATTPAGPLWITFDWDAREREGRFRGKGAARVDAPDRARLDLFGPRGESYLNAAVVEGEVLLPSSEAAALVPPPPLLWGALGIFQPPTEAQLVGESRDGNKLRLEYQDGTARWQFDFVADRLSRVEWNGPGGARKTVEIKGEGEFRLPKEAVYRDWANFAELKLKLDEVERVDSFPEDIWRLNAH
jgi:hypothetical protein